MRLHNRFLHLIWDLMMSNQYMDKIMMWIEYNILDIIFIKRVIRTTIIPLLISIRKEGLSSESI